jgi:hypothetical protein
MKWTLSLVALFGLGAPMAVSAQQTPSTTPAPPGQADSTPQQERTDKSNFQQSARTFEGKIAKSGNQFVLLDRAAQTSYRLDDQEKARKYAGKNVKVMATIGATPNLLSVIDITPAPPDGR